MDLKNLAKIDLIKELGLEQLPKEQQEKMLKDMGEIIQQRVRLRIIKEMKKEDEGEFTKMLEEKKDQSEKIEKFMKEKVPEIDDIIVEEIGKYKKEIIDLQEGIKKTVMEAK